MAFLMGGVFEINNRCKKNSRGDTRFIPNLEPIKLSECIQYTITVRVPGICRSCMYIDRHWMGTDSMHVLPEAMSEAHVTNN